MYIIIFLKGFLMLGSDTTNMYCGHFGYPVEERSNGMSPKVPGGVRTSNVFSSSNDWFNLLVIYSFVIHCSEETYTKSKAAYWFCLHLILFYFSLFMFWQILSNAEKQDWPEESNHKINHIHATSLLWDLFVVISILTTSFCFVFLISLFKSLQCIYIKKNVR